MSRLFACLVIASLAAVARAGDAPNTLSPKEIAEGWLLLFDGSTTFGWQTEGDVVVKDGWLRLGGEKPARASFPLRFRAFELTAQISEPTRGVQLFSQDVRLVPPEGVLASFQMSNRRGGICTGSISFTEDNGNGSGMGIAQGFSPYATSPPEWWTIPMEIAVPAKGKISVRSIKLRPLETKAMLNGKDLTGWKQHPKKASVWTVEDGVLRVKNGPGDLQTEDTWADFLLQAEIKTHGKALNSGIFFRAIPGDYQNGYEAQVQNAFKEGDRTKPADFGTGAIYRRVAARKVVPDDNEWFTMTVAAQGKRIATWVNGYMTVDWTDDRPADDNPRKGVRTAAGAISLQGHDPTTDISFRNLRIGGLAK